MTPQKEDARLAGFFACDDFAALVVAALATDAMGKLALMAVGALGGADRREKVMGAALGGTLLGVAAFWIRHCRFLSTWPCAGMRLAAADGLVLQNSFIYRT